MSLRGKFLAVPWDFLSSPGFPTKLRGKGGQSTLGGGNKATSKEGAYLVTRRIQGDIILGDNPAGHCFVLRDLFLRSFSNKV